MAIGGKNQRWKFRAAFSAIPTGEGDAGSISIYASSLASLSLEEGGGIQASTTGHGQVKGGTISVKADELHATGGVYLMPTPMAQAMPGDILLQGNNMSFKNGSQVGASARQGSTGKGGNITINADGKVEIGGINSAGYPSGLFQQYRWRRGWGKHLDLTAATLSLKRAG